ncbi:MAG: nucleotidyltransferase family protein, partial [Limisphaerales bacterium]
IDLAHARRADALLRSAGYRRSQPDFELTPLQLRKYFTVRHEFEYFRADGSLRLEIMWRLVNHERFHRSTLGEPPDHVALAGRSMAVLPADTAALHLLLHGADHGWFRLFWLLDIALLMQGERLDWKRLLERAGTVQLDRVFWQSLLLARELLGVALPAGLPSPPCEPVIRRLVEDAFRHMELTPDEIKTGAAHLWMTFYHWRLQPSWRVRLRALRPRFVNPADWKTLRLPDRWFALYYVLWPLLWACRRFRSKARKGKVSQDMTRITPSQ